MTGPWRGSYDAVVVGAGVIGLSCGWRAAQRGLSVLMIERAEPGAGASGVAAGMLAPVTEAEFGEERLLRLNLESVRRWPAFEAELTERSRRSVAYRQSGALVVAADRDDAEELRRLHAFQRSHDLEAEWLSGRECRRLEPGLSPRVAGGILAPQDHSVDPEALVSGLETAFEDAGGELRRGVEATGIELDGDRVVGVRTVAGELCSDHVVVAAGCWSALLGGLPDAARPPVRPVKGQILALGRSSPGPPATALAERIVRTPRCYVLDRGDGRVVIGATQEERGFDTSVTAEGVYRLLEAAWEVLPDVGELRFAGARAGLRPGTPDNAPLIGFGAVEGLVWATGHHRNGVLLAPITADAVADLLSGEELPPAVEALSPTRFEGPSYAAPSSVFAPEAR